MSRVSRDQTILIPGGNGYLGTHLARHFHALGYDVVILSRRPLEGSDGVRQLPWNGRDLGPWAAAFENAAAVVNLTGRSVNCRYTARNRAQIYASRLDSTRVIGQAIAAARHPPPLWLNSSSATIYRHALDRPMDELAGEIGTGFSVDVCQKWERALADAATPQTRKVALRSAMVFGPGAGGVFEAFDRIVRIGLGGTLGRGDQFVSWIHILDFCRAIHWIMEHPQLSGPVNLASPNPLDNRRFMQIFREVRNKSIGLPATKGMLEIGAFFLRTETELLLKSRRVIPARLLASGFQFDYPQLKEAMEQIIAAEQQIRGDAPAR